MKFSKTKMGLFFVGASSFWLAAGTIDDTYSSGDTLTVQHMENIKAAVNDNHANIASNLEVIQSKGLVSYAVLDDFNCNTGNTDFVEGVYSKIADLGTFSKTQANSVLEIVYNGNIYARNMTGTGARFELRVNDLPSTVGRVRVSLKTVYGDHVDVSFGGFFSDLAAGNHTVSMWVEGVNGNGESGMVDAGCWSSSAIRVKELN